LRVQKFCDFAGCGHGGLGAVARDGDGGYCGCVAGGIAGLFAGEQADGEAGVESVAGGGGVDRFYGEGWNHFAEAVGCGEEGALRSHFDYDISGAAREEEISAARGGFGRHWLGRREAAENARLAFVGSDPGSDLEEAAGQFARGGGIEHQRDFVAVREGAESFEGDERDFELREDHSGFAQDCGVRGDVFRREFAVGAGDYDDVVLAVAADIDERDAGGTFYGADGLHGDAGGAEGGF